MVWWRDQENAAGRVATCRSRSSRVSDVRPKQAVFAASIKQFPQRLVMLTEGDSWFSYPLNANIADYIEMMSDFSMLRLEHNGDEAREILGAGSAQLKKTQVLPQELPGRRAAAERRRQRPGGRRTRPRMLNTKVHGRHLAERRSSSPR